MAPWSSLRYRAMKGMVLPLVQQLHDVFYMPGVLVKLPGNGLYDVHKIPDPFVCGDHWKPPVNSVSAAAYAGRKERKTAVKVILPQCRGNARGRISRPVPPQCT